MSGSEAVLRRQLKKNREEILVLDAADVANAAETDRQLTHRLGPIAKLVESALAKMKGTTAVWQPVVEASAVVRILTDFKWTRAVVRERNGRSYIVFKGYKSGYRSIISGTRYLPTNLKLVEVGVGTLGRAASAVQAVRVAALIAVPLAVLLWILGDKHTVSRLFGTIAGDLIKAGLAALAGLGAGALTAGMISIVAAPIAVTFLVGAATGYALDALESHYGVTEQLILAMERVEARTVNQPAATAREIMRTYGSYEYALKAMYTRMTVEAATRR